jgi:hypothetical protein
MLLDYSNLWHHGVGGVVEPSTPHPKKASSRPSGAIRLRRRQDLFIGLNPKLSNLRATHS